MCGICGIASTRSAVDEGVLRRMTATLRHRGPDDDGFYVAQNSRGPAVGLGFRRLSIIDVEGGHQPLANEDSTIWIVFNGEIYNFPQLRAELEGKGHRFRTHTDTEVIVHLYEELGDGCVNRLNGMFAFALWDERRRRLLLARDRFGKKPLYYAPTDDGLIFGSELKALLEHPCCPREIDHEAVGQYLAFEYVPAPRSIFDGVKKLPRAHTLVHEAGRTTVTRYWDLPYTPDSPVRREEEYAEEFRELFWSAVRRRLLSDVPLGALLSGGIDSSSVVAAAVDLSPSGTVKTFSIGFAEESFDESLHARRVAEFFGTDHHEDVLTPGVMLDLLPKVLSTVDEPLADASILPTYLLSRFTRESVTVALGGDGGDELLAGYPTFGADRVARLVRLPTALHRDVLVPLAERLPVDTRNFSFEFKVKRFLRGLRYEPDLRHAVWLGAFTPPEQAALLVRQARDPLGPASDASRRAPMGDRVARLSYLYVDGYLQDDVLTKVDRASMAVSLEVRAPFLDVDLVEFLARVPSSMKLRGLQSKWLLKRAMEDRLPSGIARRAKKGFGVPVATWLRHELRDELTDTLSPEGLRRHGLFDPHEVERLIREHLAGTRDHRKQLWTLFCFQRWYETYALPIASSSLRAAPSATR
jgi:asparagine synthase (glutamine-hydrolysing)